MSSPLDRIEADLLHALTQPEVAVRVDVLENAKALVNVAKAAERLDNALVLTAPKSAQAWIRKLVPRKKLREALAALDEDWAN